MITALVLAAIIVGAVALEVRRPLKHAPHVHTGKITPKKKDKTANVTTPHHTPSPSPSPIPPITYHGGATLSAGFTVHTIFYGNAFSAGGQAILADYYKNFAASRWWGINTLYFGHTVPVHVGQNTTDAHYSRGKRINDSDLLTIVTLAIQRGLGHGNASEVYVFLFDKNVKYTTGMCVDWCGFHSNFTVPHRANPIYIIVAGAPLACPSGCSVLNPNGSDSPNSNFEMDSLINIISHELSESATDPEGTGWYNAGGEEDSDLCAWEFGTVSRIRGRLSNEPIGTRRYLIQEELNPNTQQCNQ